MSNKVAEIVEVTNLNIEAVAKDLEAEKGRILIASPRYYGSPDHILTGEFEMRLFDKPRINPKRKSLYVPRGTEKRGGQDWQTGWENDREYRLHEKPKPSDPQTNAARDFFQKLTIEKAFEFQIAFSAVIGCGICEDRHLTLFLPKSSYPAASFRYCLNWMTRLWNEQAPPKGWPTRFKFTPEHIESMVAYIVRDLETGEVFKYNV